MHAYILIQNQSLVLTASSSACHLIALGTDPNIPECSLAGISLLLIMGSLIAMHFFPF